MGLAIARLAHAAEDVSIVGAAAHSDDPHQGKDLGELAGLGSIGISVTADVASALLGADAIIDFSVAAAVKPLLSLALRAKLPVVTGTTNLDDATRAALDNAAKEIPVLWAPNMGLGIQVLAELVEHALRRLGPGFDAEIVEIHHRKKVDSPSGTAKRLADAVRAVRPRSVELHGRDGDVGARTTDEVAVLGVRGGDVVGDHTVFLFGTGERIELTHRATNRDLFAQGAIRAARFLVGKKPGRYTIADVLG
jgi:4-hydroxy-tetrahydrodipicolinate reductase